MKLSIIIPVYNVNEDTKIMTDDCIKSLGDEDIIVVDDYSPIPYDAPGHVKLIRHIENEGNAAAWNTGAKESDGDILLFSDSDIDAGEYKDEMIKALDKYEIVFPEVLTGDKVRKHLAGEFFMMKRSWYEKVGEFDESYFMYFEDSDYFKRTMLAGGKLGVAAGAMVIHKSKGSVTYAMDAEDQHNIFEKNKKKYEDKFGANYPHL